MKVLLVILLLLVLFALLRVKLSIAFGREMQAWLFIGTIRIDLLKKKEKKPKPKTKTTPKAKKSHPKPTFDEVLELLKTALTAIKRALKRLKRSVRIDPLSLSVVVADNDPAKTAQTYGYLNAAVWTLMPLAEDTFDIPDPAIHLEMDFENERIKAEGEFGASLRVIDILAILFVLLVPIGKWYVRFTKAHKNDPPSAKTEKTSEKTV